MMRLQIMFGYILISNCNSNLAPLTSQFALPQPYNSHKKSFLSFDYWNKPIEGQLLKSLLMSTETGLSKKKRKTYFFHQEWEIFYIFSQMCVCLICGVSVALGKGRSVRHKFTAVHKNFEHDFPGSSCLCSMKVSKLKSGLDRQQSWRSTSPAATAELFKVPHH